MVLQHVQREGEMRQKQKDPNMIGPFSCLLQVPSDALNNGDGAGVSLMSLRLGFCEKNSFNSLRFFFRQKINTNKKI